MTMLVRYDTTCLSCDKPINVASCNVFIDYKGRKYGDNICKDCRKFQIFIDIDKLTKRLRKAANIKTEINFPQKS